jgi:sialidase-1
MKDTKPFKRSVLLVLAIFLLGLCAVAQKTSVDYIFKNGKGGYKMYRIPTMVRTQHGTILAFCEGRQSLFDHGHIDIVVKSSNDGGKTWGPLQKIWTDGKGTCGNPCPIVDQQSGDIMVISTYDNDRVMIMRSSDSGAHWSSPRDITSMVKSPDWAWYATGPVHGIQISQGPHLGRIIIPCNHTIRGSGQHISHTIYSDDHGQTWSIGGSAPCLNTDECTVAEADAGRLILNMRNNDKTIHSRKVSSSTDGGATWSACAPDKSLIEPTCQGSLLCYNASTLLFTNPAHTKARKMLCLSVSYDHGTSWRKKIVLHKGHAAYSDMAALDNGDVVCIYETGRFWPYGGIAFMNIMSNNFINDSPLPGK